MNIVLLSGGSGKRLWPLSNNIRSKQFIKIFKKQDGGYESMVQRVYRQIKKVDTDASVTIATNKMQVSAIHNQLGDNVGISIEPCRRDTFPAIVLSTAYLADVLHIDPEESVVVCPVDPYVNDDYFEALKALSQQADKGEANLVLMGIEPTYPSEKYGYIIPVSGENVSSVSTFKEKPSEKVAKEYIAQGALWNGGVFAYKLKYVLEKAHELIDFTDYNDLYNKYETLKKISFDYAVVEKEDKIQVMRFAGEWKDLGTWNTLTEAMNDKIIGNAVLDSTCDNVHVVNELDIPVLAMGLKDVIISASAEGILVSDKDKSAGIKPYAEQFEQQVMFAEKSWGHYQVLNVENESLTIKITLNSGCSMSYHSHENRDEVWTVISGHGHAYIDDVFQNVKAGDVISIPANTKHTVVAGTKLQIIEVQTGKDIDVKDKKRHALTIDTEFFGSADIRGVYPDQVNEELAYRIGCHFPKLFNAKKIAVGYDIRLSGKMLKEALIKGLREAGCDVIDIGQCGTEMIYFTTFYKKLDGGIMITASHNPKEYNGFKFVGEGARPIFKGNGLEELERLCKCGDVSNNIIKRKGNVIQYDIISEYIHHILGYIDTKKLKPLKVLVNAGNGAAGPIIDALENELPIGFIKINNIPDGNFPNGVPNPILNENREVTAKAVKEYKADLGIAWDGDFDRCFLFDENGECVEGYYMVGLLAEAFLKDNPSGKIIHDPRVYWNTQDICRMYGGEAVMCRSGHSHIKNKMREVDAVYGGEMSAHHYFREFAYCDSGMIPWLLVVELMSTTGKKLSKMVSERIAKYPCSGEINSKVDDPDKLLEMLEDKYGEGRVEHVDGLGITFDDWRFNIRKSNTEPVVRLNVESHGDNRLLQEKITYLLKIIRR